VKKPEAKRARKVTPLTVEQVEKMRHWMLANRTRTDATMLSILAYAGLRPGEALALTWAHVTTTLHVERAVSLGEIRQTKTGVVRFVPIVAALADDIEAFRAEAADTSPEALLFPSPAGTGKPWSNDDWQNWRRRVFRPAAEAIGLEGVRPYDCRHTYVSLRIHQRDTAVEIAHDVGHAPTMTFDTYAHVINEYRGRERRDMETPQTFAHAIPSTSSKAMDAIWTRSGQAPRYATRRVQ
jgi:integrase